MARLLGVDVQARLNLRGLVRRRYALAGVTRYGFATGLDRLVLLRVSDGVDGDALGAIGSPSASATAWVDLQAEPGTAVLEPVALAAAPLALLPLAWARGLVPLECAVEANDWLQQAEVLSLWEPLQRASADGPPASELQRQLIAYQQRLNALAAGPSALAAPELALPAESEGMEPLQPLLELLQQERLLRRQIDPDCWAPAARQPLDPRPWLQSWLGAQAEASPAPGACEAFSDRLMALFHLLPAEEQDGFGQRLADGLLAGLTAADPEPPQGLLPWLRLAEGVIGGFNSRRPRLQQLERELRRQALTAAMTLEDPAARGLSLMRLLQAEWIAEQPAWLEALAAAVDALVLQIGAASGDQAKAQKREAQQQLEQLIKAGASNLPLWKRLVLALDADTCYRLPSIQPPSACLVVFKGCLLVTSADLRDASRAARLALVALFERLLPRLWWQAPCLMQLLRDLRRFPLELTWLERESKLLEPWLTLQARGLGPSGAVLASGDDAGEPALLQLQQLLLLRLLSQEEHRAGLAQRLASLSPSPIQRLLFDGSELPLLEAATAGLADRCTSLLRLDAQQCGVEELMPLLPAPLDVTQAFRRILDHWRSQLASDRSDAPLPITVVITTYRPDLERLRLAVESLALQTARPQEVLVVDDGSPEPLASELRALLTLLSHAFQLPIRLLRQEQNLGQYACRNIALAACRTEAIAIQDDDDLSHPLRLQSQWQALQQGAVAVYARHLRLDQATAHPQPDGDGLGFWGDGITTLMVRRQAAVQLGGFYPVRSRGDVEFRARLRRQFGPEALKTLKQPLYLMRASSGTVSSDFEYGCSLRLRQWRRLMNGALLV